MNYALIMAGGAGTRLWPLSRDGHSKPSLQLYSDQSMFQIAVERLYSLHTRTNSGGCQSKAHSDLAQQYLKFHRKTILLNQRTWYSQRDWSGCHSPAQA